MKKLIFTFLGILLFFTMNAQITTNVLGFNIGTSTRQNVQNTLRSKGIPYSKYGNSIIVERCSLIFAGVQIKQLYFEFYNNKLATIMLVGDVDMYDYLVDLLNEKYSDYQMEYEEGDQFIFWVDDKTQIGIGYDNGLFDLHYSNNKLLKLIQEKNKSDL